MPPEVDKAVARPATPVTPAKEVSTSDAASPLTPGFLKSSPEEWSAYVRQIISELQSNGYGLTPADEQEVRYHILTRSRADMHHWTPKSFSPHLSAKKDLKEIKAWRDGPEKDWRRHKEALGGENPPQFPFRGAMLAVVGVLHVLTHNSQVFNEDLDAFHTLTREAGLVFLLIGKQPDGYWTGLDMDRDHNRTPLGSTVGRPLQPRCRKFMTQASGLKLRRDIKARGWWIDANAYGETYVFAAYKEEDPSRTEEKEDNDLAQMAGPNHLKRKVYERRAATRNETGFSDDPSPHKHTKKKRVSGEKARGIESVLARKPNEFNPRNDPDEYVFKPLWKQVDERRPRPDKGAHGQTDPEPISTTYVRGGKGIKKSHLDFRREFSKPASNAGLSLKAFEAESLGDSDMPSLDNEDFRSETYNLVPQKRVEELLNSARRQFQADLKLLEEKMISATNRTVCRAVKQLEKKMRSKFKKKTNTLATNLTVSRVVKQLQKKMRSKLKKINRLDARIAAMEGTVKCLNKKLTATIKSFDDTLSANGGEQFKPIPASTNALRKRVEGTSTTSNNIDTNTSSTFRSFEKYLGSVKEHEELEYAMTEVSDEPEVIAGQQHKSTPEQEMVWTADEVEEADASYIRDDNENLSHQVPEWPLQASPQPDGLSRADLDEAVARPTPEIKSSLTESPGKPTARREFTHRNPDHDRETDESYEATCDKVIDTLRELKVRRREFEWPDMDLVVRALISVIAKPYGPRILKAAIANGNGEWWCFGSAMMGRPVEELDRNSLCHCEKAFLPEPNKDAPNGKHFCLEMRVRDKDAMEIEFRY